MDHRVFIFLLLIWAKVEASNTTAGSSWSVVLKVFENCADKNDSLSCLQQKVLNFANRLTQSKSLEIFDGFKFVRDEQTARSISETDSNNSGASLSDQIWNKAATFFKTHSVEMNVPKFLDTDNDVSARKKNKGNGGILLLAGAVKGAMIYFGMHAVAALAGKALIVAKIALTIASVIALKKLLEGGSSKTSYEIVKHPQHSYVQTHSSSHEYGGGGHGGGGYEGHYRKRSIAKPKVNFQEASADSWRFELPKKDPGVRFSTSINNPNEYQAADNGALNEGGEFFLYKQISDQNQAETSNRNPQFALEVDGNNGVPELGEEVSNNEDEFSPLRMKRSLFRNFA